MHLIKFRAWDIKNKKWLKPKFTGYICVDRSAIVIIDYKPNNAGGYSPEKVNFLTWPLEAK